MVVTCIVINHRYLSSQRIATGVLIVSLTTFVQTTKHQADYANAIYRNLWMNYERGDKMPRPIGVCPKCCEIKRLTKHHVFPKRYYRRNQKPVCMWLCRTCHDQLELMIPLERMGKGFYLTVVKRFMQNHNMQCDILKKPAVHRVELRKQ